MVKKILIPTDFCVASLNTLRQVLEVNNAEQMYIVLVYAEHTSDSEIDLLFYSPEKIISKNITSQFREALEVLRNRYSSLRGIEIKLLHGNSSGYVRNFLSANSISEIHLPKTYKLKISKNGFDPVDVLRKASVPVFEKDWEQYLNKSEQEHLIALFN